MREHRKGVLYRPCCRTSCWTNWTGVGATRTPTRPIRGRLQYLCPQSAGRRAGDGEYHRLHHCPAQTQGKPAEKCGGKTLGAEVLGLQLYARGSTETADRAEGAGASQKAGARADATDSRDQHRGDGCRTRKLAPGMARLLWGVPNSVAVERAGSVDQAATAVVLMEAVETWSGAVRRADPAGRAQGSCRSYGQESSRSVASRQLAGTGVCPA